MSGERSDVPRRSATERADELIDRAARGAVRVAPMALAGFARLLAYAREGAEDIWAEAQSIRRGTPNSEPHKSVGTDAYVGAGVSERGAEPGKEASAIQVDATHHPLTTWMHTSGRARTTFGASRTPGYAASSRRT
jgi:hypothetical protein